MGILPHITCMSHKYNYMDLYRKEGENDLIRFRGYHDVKTKQRENGRFWPWVLEWWGHKPKHSESPRAGKGQEQMLP